VSAHPAPFPPRFLHYHRKRMNTTICRTGTVLCLFLASGCISIMRPRLTAHDISDLIEQPMSKSQIQKRLGRPTSKMTTNEKTTNFYKVRKYEDLPTSHLGREKQKTQTKTIDDRILVSYSADGMVNSVSLWFSRGKILKGTIAKLKKNSTTRAEAQNLLGLPSSTIFKADKTVQAGWIYSDPQKIGGSKLGRILAESQLSSASCMDFQSLFLTFDSNGILQDLKYNDAPFVSQQHHEDFRNRPPIDTESVRLLKTAQADIHYVTKLLGEPDFKTRYSSGQIAYSYMRKPHDDNLSSVLLQFFPTGKVKLIKSTYLSVETKTGPDVERNVQIFAQSLRLAQLLASGASKIQGAPISSRRISTTVTVGHEIDHERLQSLAVGKSTPADLFEVIGPPDSVEWTETGRVKSYGYIYSISKSSNKLFSSDSSRSTTVTLSFDEKELLCDIAESKTTSSQ